MENTEATNPSTEEVADTTAEESTPADSLWDSSPTAEKITGISFPDLGTTSGKITGIALSWNDTVKLLFQVCFLLVPVLFTVLAIYGGTGYLVWQLGQWLGDAPNVTQ